MKQDFWYLIIFFLMAISLFIFLLSGCHKIVYENTDSRICPSKCNDANTYDFDCENCITFK